jgi:hypothetical protein
MPEGIRALPNVYDPDVLSALIRDISVRRQGLDPLEDQLSSGILDVRVNKEIDRYLNDAKLTQMLQSQTNERVFDFEQDKLDRQLRNSMLDRQAGLWKDRNVVGDEIADDYGYEGDSPELIEFIRMLDIENKKNTNDKLKAEALDTESQTKYRPDAAISAALNAISNASNAGIEFDMNNISPLLSQRAMKGINQENTPSVRAARLNALATVEAARREQQQGTSGNRMYVDVFTKDGKPVGTITQQQYEANKAQIDQQYKASAPYVLNYNNSTSFMNSAQASRKGGEGGPTPESQGQLMGAVEGGQPGLDFIGSNGAIEVDTQEVVVTNRKDKYGRPIFQVGNRDYIQAPP